MRLPEAFLATLDRRARVVLANPQACGLHPFYVGPGVAGALSQYGIDLGFVGTPPTVSSPVPDPTGLEHLRYAHTLLVSGDGAGQPAGLFGTVTANQLAARSGWVSVTTVSGSLPFGARGTIDAYGRVFAPDFEPEGLDFGWAANSNRPVGDGWVWYDASGTTVLGAAAPRDDRRYVGVIIVEAGATNTPTGYRLLIDLSDPDAPVVADAGVFSIPADWVGWAEKNRSAGPLPAGQPPVSLRHYSTEGARIVRRV